MRTIDQALTEAFFTDFWAKATNDFAGFLSLGKSLSLEREKLVF